MLTQCRDRETQVLTEENIYLEKWGKMDILDLEKWGKMDIYHRVTDSHSPERVSEALDSC